MVQKSRASAVRFFFLVPNISAWRRVMPLNYFGMTDQGLMRNDNQDSYYMNPELGIFIIADGMGGLKNGALAARFVVTSLAAGLMEILKNTAESDDIENVVHRVFRMVNRGLRRFVGSDAGSTAVMALVKEQTVLIANLGDSRAYLVLAEGLEQLTEEHTLAKAMVQAGRITADEALHHPLRHHLTGYMGMPNQEPTHMVCRELHPGARLLLCSDGLTTMLEDNEIHRVLTQNTSLENAARELVTMANLNGGLDNTTVILLEWPLQA